jgi:hypothetical protein
MPTEATVKYCLTSTRMATSKKPTKNPEIKGETGTLVHRKRDGKW